MRRWIFLAFLGCGPAAKPVPRLGRPPVAPVAAPVATPSPELSPALAPLAWWLGDWKGDDGTEHWVAAAGAIYGIALRGATFEVMIVDDAEGPGPADGVRRFIAMPNGERQVEFRERAIMDGSATFANDAHDFPKTITYRKADHGLVATIAAGDKSIPMVFQPTTTARAPELEAADRAFSDDTGKRGIEGWLAAFEPKGAMMRKTGRIEGHAAIREAMAKVLASGKLEWAPIASAATGDLGFTVGKATFTGTAPDDRWRSTYVTIWRRQPGSGDWKVGFDVGRIVNE